MENNSPELVTERRKLDELIAAAEAEHGAITAEEIEEKRQALLRAREVVVEN
ncbi:hypothetical protein GCM10022247_14500 [Allokutzneria multivorans]|uniref:Uncharacterized protein n=1 Tax=Allokutzneria multivorans TaxID=1142134 RepID=A0ABP7RCF6_9PSEU